MASASPTPDYYSEYPITLPSYKWISNGSPVTLIKKEGVKYNTNTFKMIKNPTSNTSELKATLISFKKIENSANGKSGTYEFTVKLNDTVITFKEHEYYFKITPDVPKSGGHRRNRTKRNRNRKRKQSRKH
jgi:hypothetical protein